MKKINIDRELFVVSQWTGGTTTQLYISPECSELSRRDFNLRISSASFTDTSSKFSDFTGYQRFILPLEGKLTIRHEQGSPIALSPYEVHHFDGSVETYAENSPDCIDFNLIVKNDIASELSVLRRPESNCDVQRDHRYFFYAAEDFHLYHREQHFPMSAGNLHIFEFDENDKITIKLGQSPVIVCKVAL